MKTGAVVDGKYRIDRLLGQGGMGAVYRATHLGTTRSVALKVIHPHLLNRPEFTERFRREAEAAGRLRHPNVVDVTDFGVEETDDGRIAYLVMEFLDGCTLGDILAEERRLPLAWVVDILEQASSALDEAHAQGLVHRDLKPDNIWLEPNRRGGYTVKILDFGLVKLGDLAEPAATRGGDAGDSGSTPSDEVTRAIAVEATSALTMVSGGLTGIGSVTGTPLYMSPEQWDGRPTDGRSDVYSLGVITYRMLAGEPPFSGDPATLRRLHRESPPPPLKGRVRGVPRRVRDLVMTTLAKDPADRPARAGGFAAALRSASEGSGTLLRQAMSLYSERFPVLLRLSLLAYLPLFLFLGVVALVDANRSNVSGVVGALVVLTMIAVNVAAYLALPAVVAPVVVQASVAPLQPSSLEIVWIALRHRWRPLAVATAMVIAVTLAGSLLLIVPGVIAAIAHVLYAPVVVMEDIPARAALRRARLLARRSWTTVLNITVLQFALPVLVWTTAVDASFVFRVDEQWQPQELSFALNGSWKSALYQLLNVFVAPLTGTMTALLYLKSRHAGGESLQPASDRFVAAGGRDSRWQVRMRSRSRSDGSIPEPSAPSPAG